MKWYNNLEIIRQIDEYENRGLMDKKKDEIKDIEVISTSARKNDLVIKRERNSVESEKEDAEDESVASQLGSTDIVLADRRGEVAALTISDLTPRKVFDKKSPVVMIWDNRSNQWMNFRSLDEVGEVFRAGDIEVYVAMPTFYKKLKTGFQEA